MADREELLKTLEELGDGEFRIFRWFLQQPDILEGSSTIPQSHLDNADRPKTVDKIIQTYNHQPVEVVKKTLKKINRNDLVGKLSNINTGEHGVWGTMADKEELLKTLQELGDDEFRNFKWHLEELDILEGYSLIPICHLEKADRLDTVNKIVQTYNHQPVEVVKKILKKINRNDLVEKLSAHVEEIQQSLRSRCLSTAEQSSAQLFAVVFILPSSGKHLDVFDLKRYSASDEALQRPLPEVKASYKALIHQQRPDSPAPSYVSMRSDWSMTPPPCLNSERIHQQRPDSPAPSYVSMRSDWSMTPPPCLNSERIHQQRPASPAPSCVSMKSDRSIDPPIRFNSERIQQQRPESPDSSCVSVDPDRTMDPPLLSKTHGEIHQQRPDSPVPSYVSMSSDRSIEPPIDFNSERTYEDIISKSLQISSGSPDVYQLIPKEEKFGTLTRKTVGEKNLNKTNKTILLVGETGAGKSTLINVLVNYTMGVKFKDNIWFEIVEEQKRRCQTESQTSDVIVYEIFGFEDKTLPFSLTIIDTPGYGSTEGNEHDVIISQRLFDLFRSEDGVHEIDVVGLVLQVSVNRLSDRLKYIFDSVTSLFGKDIEKNIVALITHSDGITPENVLKALEAANIKCAKNEKNQPVHFLFNNRQTTQKTEETEFALENIWRVTERGMKRFTDFLEKSKPQQLITTLEVLKARIRITACINNLQDRIQLIELKQNEIQQTQEALKKHEEEMKKNEKFTIEVDEVYKEKKSIDGGMWGLFFYKAAVTCNICEENCHFPGCTMAWSPKHCEVMKGGRCTACTEKCPATKHVKENWIYVNKTRKVKKTFEDVKQKYEENKVDHEQKKSLLENLQTEMKKLESEKIQLLAEVYQYMEQLEQIALNVNSLSTHVHLDFLIEKMKEIRATEKVKKLEEMAGRLDEKTRAAMRYMSAKLTGWYRS
ncbi:uncharacterized protein [Thunnus thynnus]|uniref:uncharacterized protein n=1 Tax=Thunnus thynnus TaxID=8237 RepID=UPI0035296EC0